MSSLPTRLRSHFKYLNQEGGMCGDGCKVKDCIFCRARAVDSALVKVVEALTEYEDRIASCECHPDPLFQALAELEKVMGEK